MLSEGTTTAEALLGMLSLCPMSGYELRKLIGESIGNFWAESYGQIYPTLKRLEKAELVRSAEGERAGSKVYSLTEAGSARLREWLGVAPKRQVPRSDLLLKLFLWLPVSDGDGLGPGRRDGGRSMRRTSCGTTQSSAT